MPQVDARLLYPASLEIGEIAERFLMTQTQFDTLPIESIRPDPDQPRKTFDDESIEALAETYRTEGQIVPIEVDETGMIVTGERRWRAARKAGLEEVDVIVHTPKNRLRRQLIEEFHRENIPPLERARAMKRLIGSGFSPIELAKDLSLARSTVRDLLSLVREPEIEEAVEREKVQPTKAVELQKALGPEKTKEFIRTHEPKEIEKLRISEDIRPLRQVPDRVKEAVSRGEVDVEDVVEIADLVPEEEEVQDEIIRELRTRKGVKEFERDELRRDAESSLAGSPRTVKEVDRTQRGRDERVLGGIGRRLEGVGRLIPATFLSIKDEDLREEAVQALVRTFSHIKSILEALGRYDVTVLDV